MFISFFAKISISLLINFLRIYILDPLFFVHITDMHNIRTILNTDSFIVVPLISLGLIQVPLGSSFNP